MAIDVNFDTPPTPPSSTDKINFRVRYDAFFAYIVVFVGKLIQLIPQINSIAAFIQACSDAAVAAANFKGTWAAGTAYSIGQSILRSGATYVAILPSTGKIPESEPTYWLPTGISSLIHASPVKATPIDADEFPILDSAASFGLKRYTFANIKVALLSYINSVGITKILPTSLATAAGNEGGQITFQMGTTNDYAIVGNIAIDIVNGYLRIYETGGTNRGVTLPLFNCSAYVSDKIITDKNIPSLGVNQIYTNVTSLKLNNTNYINSTGNPIHVAVTAINDFSFYVDGVLISRHNNGDINTTAGGCVIVPNGSTYKVYATYGIITWMELRS